MNQEQVAATENLTAHFMFIDNSHFVVANVDLGEAKIDLCKYLYELHGEGDYINHIEFVKELPCQTRGCFVLDVTEIHCE